MPEKHKTFNDFKFRAAIALTTFTAVNTIAIGGYIAAIASEKWPNIEQIIPALTEIVQNSLRNPNNIILPIGLFELAFLAISTLGAMEMPNLTRKDIGRTGRIARY